MDTCKEPLIKLKDFTFTYDGSKIPSLSNITLNIKAGEVILLTGQSGCGKTTFTRCMNGLIPDFFEGEISGTCYVNGMDIGKYETGDYSYFVGSVFQDPRSQFFTLHVKTEIPFQCENLGQEKADIQKKYKESIDVFKINNLLDKSIFKLSSGEKQKIAVTSAYTAGVHIYVLDEPSANLDQNSTKQLYSVLKKLKDEGNTIIISQHKIYYLKDLVDRVVFMKEGEIDEDLSKENIVALSSDWMEKHAMRQFDLSKSKQFVPNVEVVKNALQIRADKLSFNYGKQLLWKNVSFNISGGDIVGVIGENGAGKSTLFRVLMGLEKPGSGKIFINKKQVSSRNRRNISFYVMQDVDYQLFASSVLEEMLLSMAGTGEDKEKALQVLELFGLSTYAQKHPSKLSGGQKQRLSIALAYMSDAKILFMDEPTSGLDYKNMQLVSKAIFELAKKGCCLFVITHDYEFAAQTFKSLLVLKDTKEIERVPQDKYKVDTLYQKFKLIKEIKK